MKDYLTGYSEDGNKSDSLECERFVLSPSKFSLLLRILFLFCSYPDKSTRSENRSIWCARTLSRRGWGGVEGGAVLFISAGDAASQACLHLSLVLRNSSFGSARAASYQQLRSHHAGTNLITHALLMNSLWAFIKKNK